MKTTYFFNPAIPAHGVDITTDTGECFGIACPDETTARTIAAIPELLDALREADKELRFHNWQNSTTGMLISNLVNQFPPC